MATHAFWHVQCLCHPQERDSSSATQNCEQKRQYGDGLHRRHRSRHRNRGGSHGAPPRSVRMLEAGFKMRVASSCDFMKYEIIYLGRKVSAEGPIPRPWRNYAIGKFPATRPKCKVSWVLLTITVSSFLDMPNWLLPCSSLLALTPRLHGGLNNNWLSMK